jgi:TonB family protein
MRYSGPQLLSSWLHGAAPRQPSCQLPRRARAVGPAELTVRQSSASRVKETMRISSTLTCLLVLVACSAPNDQPSSLPVRDTLADQSELASSPTPTPHTRDAPTRVPLPDEDWIEEQWPSTPTPQEFTPPEIEHIPRFHLDLEGSHRWGITVIRFTVAADGTATDFSIYRTSGIPEFDDACLESVKDGRYRAAIKDGSPIDHELIVTCRPHFH